MKIKLSILFGATSLLLASCLKSKDSLGLIDDKGSIVTEIADVNISGDLKPVALNATPPSETFTLITLKSYAPRSNKPAGGKVHVKLALDNSAVTSAGLTVLPTNSYTLPAMEFDVPSSGELSIPITLNKAALDLSQSYGIGLKIAEVNQGVISELAKSIVVNILVKNKYDGVYTMKGHHNRSPYDYPYLTEMHMITYGATSVAFYWPDAGSYGHPIGVGPDPVNDLNWYGATVAPVVVFDANDKVSDVYNNSSAGPVITRFDGATGSNVGRWDPVTKQIIVHWNYSGNPQRAFFDTLTYVGPR